VVVAVICLLSATEHELLLCRGIGYNWCVRDHF